MITLDESTSTQGNFIQQSSRSTESCLVRALSVPPARWFLITEETMMSSPGVKWMTTPRCVCETHTLLTLLVNLEPVRTANNLEGRRKKKNSLFPSSFSFSLLLVFSNSLFFAFGVHFGKPDIPSFMRGMSDAPFPVVCPQTWPRFYFHFSFSFLRARNPVARCPGAKQDVRRPKQVGSAQESWWATLILDQTWGSMV